MEGKLEDLREKAGYVTDLPAAAVIIKSAATRRELVQVSKELSQLAQEPMSGDDALDAAEALLMDLRERQGGVSSAVALDALIADRIESIRNPVDVPEVRWPFVDKQRWLGSMRAGQLVIVGARPGMGKTAFALALATHAAVEQERGVFFASLEMTGEELADRVIARSDAHVGLDRLTRRETDAADLARIEAVQDDIGTDRLVIDPTGGLSLAQIASAARRVKSRHGDLGLVLIDYTELVGFEASDGDERESEALRVGRIAIGAKNLGKSLDCTVVLLSQLNRNSEARAERRPGLADLRSSGQLEAAADVVIGLYRDEVYDPDTDDQGIGEVIVLKNRQGPTGTKKLAYIGERTMWADLA